MDLIVVGLIALPAYWIGWAVGRRDRPVPPWPEAKDCEPLPPLARRILPYLALPDLPEQITYRVDEVEQYANSGYRLECSHVVTVDGPHGPTTGRAWCSICGESRAVVGRI